MLNGSQRNYYDSGRNSEVPKPNGRNIRLTMQVDGAPHREEIMSAVGRTVVRIGLIFPRDVFDMQSGGRK
jgi:hypothetical protein